MYDRTLNTPSEEIEGRIKALQRAIADKDIEGALVVQRVDLLYFTGTIQQAVLYVPAAGEPLLMVSKTLARARAESPLERVVALSSPRGIPALLQREGYPLPRTVGMELDVMPTNLYFGYRAILGDPAVSDISPEIRLIRAVKSPYEIELMREAAAYSDRLAATVPDLLRPGMTEIELAGKVEAEARRWGHQGVVRMRLWGSEMFFGHLLAGPSGAVPSFLSSPTGGSGVSPAVAQGAGFRPIKRREPVMVDYVFVYRGYVSDHSRVFSIGRLPEPLAAAHAAMLELQARIMDMARPGVPAGSIYDAALDFAVSRGYGDHFMGFGAERIRFVGHGVGLELDEFPFLNTGQALVLEPDMVIALEPKLIFPGKGVVGIENTHRVTEDGLEKLGQFPDEIIEI